MTSISEIFSSVTVGCWKNLPNGFLKTQKFFMLSQIGHPLLILGMVTHPDLKNTESLLNGYIKPYEIVDEFPIPYTEIMGSLEDLGQATG